MARTFFVGGNFKMNGTLESTKSIVEKLNSAPLASDAEVVISPSFPYLAAAKSIITAKNISVAAQNSADRPNGAFTGEVSVAQIKDVGADWVIIGHSERRTIIKESDELIADKTKYALDNGLKVILCIGETFEEKQANKTLEVCERQLSAVISKISDWTNVVVAYEPVWAIGTGLAATPEDAQNIHADLRKFLSEKLGKSVADSLRIIYGGSVNGANATSFKDKADVDGFLVGGASLKPEFIDIVNSRQ
ncbi:Triosephosphate isomerase [Nadsonia fulvescens var. elongata DSM 6958]|uniref:Triosephosphate isomerase n=1 Tax=Nadsonia fulvescens var. elongata DSM 6958 TaxID=857566 RepID=A0A1E3PK01_9ASCO|nr:Triosephosphate isomerase [Nadsonia fulvescens var. elongata DSM 6958]